MDLFLSYIGLLKYRLTVFSSSMQLFLQVYIGLLKYLLFCLTIYLFRYIGLLKHGVFDYIFLLLFFKYTLIWLSIGLDTSVCSSIHWFLQVYVYIFLNIYFFRNICVIKYRLICSFIHCRCKTCLNAMDRKVNTLCVDVLQGP